MGGVAGVVWHGVKEFDDALLHLDASVKRAAIVAGKEAGAELALVAKTEAPHGKTGLLAGSIAVQFQTISGNPLVRVGPTIVYGRRVDLGFKGLTKGGKQRRHGIYEWRIDTGWQGRKVRTGWTTRGLQPTRPNRFMERALDAATPRMAQIYHRAWADAITKF